MSIIGRMIKNTANSLYEKTSKILKNKKENIKNTFEKIKKEEIDEKTLILNEKINKYNKCRKYLSSCIELNILLNKKCKEKNIDTDYLFEDKIIKTVILNKEMFDSLKATSLGSCCSYLLYVLVGKFGTASTGTAINTLHGIVAKNAILSNIGFGSVATGGFGITGGMAILGIITLTPLVISKIAYNIKNRKQLKDFDEAYKHLDDYFLMMSYSISEINKINEELEKILEEQRGNYV